jgi:hypothetical protein
MVIIRQPVFCTMINRRFRQEGVTLRPFGILDFGLRPVGAIRAYAPEGFWISGIATLYQFIIDRMP